MFTKNRLGIYLTPKRTSLVETKGKKIIKKHSFLFEEKGEISEPENEIIKKVASFNEALRESKIKTKDSFVGLSSEELIIRSFIIPAVPSKEIPSVINFEAKRYIPFPLPELVCDFQYRLDKLAKKLVVVFVGMKKEVFKFYNSVFEQTGFKVLGLEPGTFSILRLLKTGKKINKKGSFGLIDINEDESNFTIILNGFPFFNRQIKIPTLKEEEKPFRFHSEVRISLDYFRRQFPGRDIDKILLLTEEPFLGLVGGLEDEIGISTEVIDTKALLEKGIEPNIGELKAFSLGLRSLDPKTISLNLFKPQVLIEKPVEVVPKKVVLPRISPKVIIRPLIIVILIIFFSFFLGQQRLLPLKRQLTEKEKEISLIKISSPFSTLSDLQNIGISHQEKLRNLDEEFKKLKLKITPIFDLIPRLTPEGIWLEDLSFAEGGLRLKGFCYLGEEKSEFDTVYKFLSSLKGNEIFKQRFEDVRLISVSRTKLREFSLTNFEISAK